MPSDTTAQTECIANYATERGIVRSETEARLLELVPSALRAALNTQIGDAFRGSGWATPFAQARYDDMIYTLETMESTLGTDLAPDLRAAVVYLFTSPVFLREATRPLADAIETTPEAFEGLMARHVGGYKYWAQFSLCPFHSPYSFFDNLHSKLFMQGFSGSPSDASEAHRSVRAEIPMRSLGGDPLIIRRSYLPDPQEPRVRFAAPPCGDDPHPRNIEHRYDTETQSWVRTEPYLDIGTWYVRGYEDPGAFGHGATAANTPDEFSQMQDTMAQRFESEQAEIGLPVALPTDIALTCGETEDRLDKSP